MLKEAFERVGLSPAHIAFAAACHDLAKLALNKQPDPARAAHTWLGMASGQMFREGPLKEFLSAVAKERAENMSSARVRGPLVGDAHAMRAPTPADTDTDGERGQKEDDAHVSSASSPSEPSFGAERDHPTGDVLTTAVSPAPESDPVSATGQLRFDAQPNHAPAPTGANSDDGNDQTRVAVYQTHVVLSSDAQRERGGHPSSVTQARDATALAPRGPTQQQINAVTRAKERSADIMSGVYIPDHRGGRELFDDVKIRYYNLTRERVARAVGRNSVAYNLIRIAETRLPANHEQMAGTTTSRDIFTASEIRTMQQQAVVFAGSGLISLPEELRSVVVDAIEAA